MTHRQTIDQRQTFAVELGHLVRTVTRREGGTYNLRRDELMVFLFSEMSFRGWRNLS